MELIEMAWRFPVWEALVAVELDLPVTFPVVARRAAAVSVLHPGAGRIGGVDGAEQLRADRRVSRLKLKVAVGDDIAARAGVGDDIGYVLLDGRDPEDVLDAVRFVDRTLMIRLDPEPAGLRQSE